MSRANVCALVALVLASAACCGGPNYETDPGSGWQPTAPRSTARSTPSIAAQVPMFPPIGPAQPLVVSVADSGGDLSRIDVGFRNSKSFDVTGGSATVTVPAEVLGEGRGTLRVRAHDGAGAFADWSRAGTVVDLRAPVVVPPAEGAVRAGQPVAIWIADDWALGSYEATHDDWELKKSFPPAWPATAGTDWDETLLLTPPLTQDGWHQITVHATDAAGNTVTTILSVDVDAVPPKASVLVPIAGAKLSGSAKMLLAVADDRDAPATLEVLLGGVPVATVLGPSATVEIDVGGFATGPTELVIIPTDAAGNTGDPVSVPVVID